MMSCSPFCHVSQGGAVAGFTHEHVLQQLHNAWQVCHSLQTLWRDQLLFFVYHLMSAGLVTI